MHKNKKQKCLKGYNSIKIITTPVQQLLQATFVFSSTT